MPPETSNAAKRILRTLRSGMQSRPLLRGGGHDIGWLLQGGSLDDLQEVLRGLGQVEAAAPDDARTAGYLEALSDVVGSSLRARVRDEDAELAKEYVSRTPQFQILVFLGDGVRTPSEISAHCERDAGQVSRVLGQMRDLGLAELCHSDGHDGRKRPHRLTLKGRRLLEEARRLRPSDEGAQAAAASSSPTSTEVDAGVAEASTYHLG